MERAAIVISVENVLTKGKQQTVGEYLSNYVRRFSGCRNTGETTIWIWR